MIVYDGQKYACITCIRGHRSSLCDHKSRVLLQIRKRGRRHQSGAVAPRVAILSQDNEAQQCRGKCCGSNDGKFKVVHIQSAMSVPQSMESTPKDEDVHMTDKFVFLPVGDGLYRKEPRSVSPKLDLSNSATPLALTDSSENGHVHRSSDEAELRIHSNNHGLDSPMSNGLLDSSYREEYTALHGAPTYTPLDRGRAPGQLSQIQYGDDRESRESTIEPQLRAAPMVIAPMHVSDDFFNQIGLSAQEATELWPESEPNGVTLAPQCIIPGQCACGQGCSCPDCYEHGNEHHDGSVRAEALDSTRHPTLSL